MTLFYSTIETGDSSAFVTITLSVIAGVVTLGTAYLSVKLRQVHVLVNSKMDTALKRIEELEAKLGLASGEQVPGAKILTETSSGATPAEKLSDLGE